MIVKRIIGMPGDTVKMENDQLTINGKKYDEPYLDEFKKNFQKISYKENMLIAQDSKHKQKVHPPLRVTLNILCQKESIFVLGDNRLISKDSRMFGLVDKDMIQGKVVFRYWPLSEIKIM